MVSRNTVLIWIKRGVIALILAIVLYLCILAGFSIWITTMWLLFTLLVMLAVKEIVGGRKKFENE